MKLSIIRARSLFAMCTLGASLGCAFQAADGPTDNDEVRAMDEVTHSPATVKPFTHAPPPSEGDLREGDTEVEGAASHRLSARVAPFTYAPPPSEGDLREDDTRVEGAVAHRVTAGGAPFTYAPPPSEGDLREGDTHVGEAIGK